MSFQGFASALVISIAAISPLSAMAHTQNSDKGSTDWQADDGFDQLYKKSQRNEDLTSGDFSFGQFHSSGSNFFDTWSFTLADSSNVSINLLDAFIPLGTGGLNETTNTSNWSFNGNSLPNFGSNKKTSYSGLLDNKWLTASLFDEEGSLLGSIGENGTLNLNNLIAGEWYTLTVSGKASGLLGGLYHGSVDIDPVAAVPLSDSLPFFMSALGVLALRSRKSKTLASKMLAA